MLSLSNRPAYLGLCGWSRPGAGSIVVVNAARRRVGIQLHIPRSWLMRYCTAQGSAHYHLGTRLVRGRGTEVCQEQAEDFVRACNSSDFGTAAMGC